MKPILLGPNCPPRFFEGGAAIARLRGIPPFDRRAPEDWVASTTTLFGEAELGLTRLPDGRWLRDAVTADPEGFLGTEHAAAWGADPALLVKLLHAGQRLPVHCHPDREFARRHLDCPFGKTEAWIVVEAAPSPGLVYLGFREDVDERHLAELVEAQDTDAMLAAMNAVPVSPGDTVLVPAGLPHAIGAGVFVVELQEPTDWSVLLEWDGFEIDGPADGHLGLGFDVALEAVDRSGWETRRVRTLLSDRQANDAPRGRRPLLPVAADAYFRAERLSSAGSRVPLGAGFSVIAVLAGRGELSTEHGGVQPLQRGDTVLVPHGAGASAVDGDLEAIRCRPPLGPSDRAGR